MIAQGGGRMGRAIVITSGKGGSGRSTLTAVLGMRLAMAGRRVAMIDMDMGMRSLDILLGMENKVVYDLVDVAEGVCRLKQALVRTPECEGLCLLSASQSRDSGALSTREAQDIVDRLKPHFDELLIDCPAGVGRGFRNATAGADEALIVALADPVSLRDADRVAGLIRRQGLDGARLVVNRAARALMRPDAPLNPDKMAQALGLSLLGVIPEDRALARWQDGAAAALIHTAAGAAIERVAQRLLGQSVPIAPFRRGVWARIRSLAVR